MADNKKSFLLYTDLIHTVKKMPKEKAGELLLHILEYVNDLDPITDDLLVEIAFEPIKQQLKRDLKEWEVIKEEKSLGGRIGNLKRWNKDLYELYQDKELTIEDAEKIAKSRILSHTDKKDGIPIKSIASIAVTVNDTVNVNVNDMNTNTGQHFEKNKKEDMVVVEMMKTWMKYNPNYFEEKENDYTASLQIAYKIAKYKKWKEVDVVGSKEKDVLASWEKICQFIRSDQFLKKLSVTNIANQFQMVVQKMNNPTENDFKTLNQPISSQTNPNIKPATDEMVDKYRKQTKNAVTNP